MKKLLCVEAIYSVIVILLLLLYLIVGYYNNYVQDDYLFLMHLNSLGFWKSILHVYNDWQGRLSINFDINVLLLAGRHINILFIHIIILLSLFFLGIYLLINHLFRLLKISCKPTYVILFALYIIVFFIEIVYEKTAFYWLCASIGLYKGLAIAILGIAVLLSGKINMLIYVLLAYFFFRVGSYYEQTALAVIIILLQLYIVTLRYSNNTIFSNQRFKLIVSIIFCSIGLTLSLIAPGTQNRRADFPEPEIIRAIIVSANSLYHYYKLMFLPELGKIVLFASPFAYFGYRVKETNRSIVIKHPLKIIAVLMGVLMILLVVNFLLLGYGTSGIGDARTLTHIAFFIALFFSASAFLLGYSSYIGRQLSTVLSYAGAVILLVSISQYYFKSLPETILYSKSERDRIQLLLNEKSKGRTEVLELDTLHYNKYVLVKSNEIYSDTTGDWNKVIRDALGLGYNIKSKHKTVTGDIFEPDWRIIN